MAYTEDQFVTTLERLSIKGFIGAGLLLLSLFYNLNISLIHNIMFIL